MKNLLTACLSFISLLALVTTTFWSSDLFAHEKSFPTKQLTALTPEGLSLTFKEALIQPDPPKLLEFEKQNAITFSKGELAGNLFIGSDSTQKAQIVVVFLDGKSERGETEFGAAIDTKGRMAEVKVFSSSEPGASKEFLSTLRNKNALELKEMMTQLQKDPSQQYLTELALKAIGRVSSSFK